MQVDKDDEERFYVEQFAKIAGELQDHDGEFLRGQPPSPDFLYRRAGRTIGIEVRRLLRPEEDPHSALSMQAQEPLRESVVQLAKEIHGRSGGRVGIDASTGFSNCPIIRERVESLAHAIADLIGELRLPLGQERELEGGDEDIPPEIDYIRVWHSDYIPSRWRWPTANWSSEIAPEVIRDIIAEKEKRLTRYRAECDEVWLLLGIAGYPASRSVHIHPDVEATEFETAFDRVFIVEHFRDRVLHLRVTRTEPSLVP